MTINGTDITMTRGDTEHLKVTCPERPFGPGDMVELTVREVEAYGPVLLHKRVTEFTDGAALIAFAPEDTAGLPFCEASYDVQATFTDLGVKTIVKPSRFVIGKEDTYAERTRRRR